MQRSLPSFHLKTQCSWEQSHPFHRSLYSPGRVCPFVPLISITSSSSLASSSGFYGKPGGHLIKGMFVERPPARKLIPFWDLGTILHKLAKAPFEPAGSSFFHHLTVKMAFLLADSTACWRSKLHALSVAAGHLRWEPGGVRLIPEINFLTKNQSLNFSFLDIFVPSLTSFSGIQEDKL